MNWIRNPEKFVVVYNENIDPKYEPYGLNLFSSTTFETASAGLAKFCSTIVVHIRDIVYRVRTLETSQRGRQAVLPRCGADGVQLTKVSGTQSVACYGERDPGVVLSALLQHLKLEAYIDESMAYHPVVFRKAKS